MEDGVGAKGKVIYFRPAVTLSTGRRNHQPEQPGDDDEAASSGASGGGGDVGGTQQSYRSSIDLAGHFLSDCWVIDFSIRNIGTPISASLSRNLFPTDPGVRWVTPSGGWGYVDNIKVTFLVEGPEQQLAYYSTQFSEDSASRIKKLSFLSHVAFSNFPETTVTSKGSTGILLNGRYEQTPNKINGLPHFVKRLPASAAPAAAAAAATAAAAAANAASLSSSSSRVAPPSAAFGARRHLFFSTEASAWVLAARCDESEGLLAVLDPQHRNRSKQEALAEGTLRFKVNMAAAEGAAEAAEVLYGLPNNGESHRQLKFATAEEEDAFGTLKEETALTIMPLSAEQAEREFGMESVHPSERYRLAIQQEDDGGGDGDDDGNDADGGGGGGDANGGDNDHDAHRHGAGADAPADAALRAARRLTAHLMPWEGSNHETLVVARSGPRTGGLRLLCLNDSRLQRSLHPDLLSFLADHGVVTTGEASNVAAGASGAAAEAMGAKKKQKQLAKMTAEARAAAEAAMEAEHATLHGLLGEVTDRHLSSKRALRLLGGRYVLTPDTLLKVTGPLTHSHALIYSFLLLPPCLLVRWLVLDDGDRESHALWSARDTDGGVWLRQDHAASLPLCVASSGLGGAGCAWRHH